MTVLDGKVALVAGAGPDVGRACAMAYAREGATVVVGARRLGPLEELASEVARETGARVVPHVVDLADQGSCGRFVARAIAECGRVDALVNVATAGGSGGRIDEGDWEGWQLAFDVNVVGTLEISRLAARSMVEHGGGTIVQIGTQGAHSTPPGSGAYNATKRAMMTASLVLAKELGSKNVRVNVVTPGYITGAGLDSLIERRAARTGRSEEDVSAELASTAALRRHVSPEDIAEAVLFLSTPRSANITGVELPVTAGQRG
jgi:NAD(P)-dependent dehydrogenase (short-subunit alcohol dehydrogenase family)